MPISNMQREMIVQKHSELIHHGLKVLPTLEHGIPGGLGNKRWTSELIFATFQQATTGKPPTQLEYKVGKSGGGFDRLDFKNIQGGASVEGDGYDLSIDLNRRSFGPKITIPIPIYGAGMSFGSVSLNFMLARAIAAERLNTFTSTGEGGYPPQLMQYKDCVITQVATGMFGVREETIQAARIVEFKYAQGAKPSLGGHLLADKVTSEVASMRESTPFTSLYSPFPFHSVYSVEDHKKHVDWIRAVNPNCLVSVKVSTPVDVDMVAIGSYYADCEYPAHRRRLRWNGCGTRDCQEEHCHADRVCDSEGSPLPGRGRRQRRDDGDGEWRDKNRLRRRQSHRPWG